MAKLYKFGGLVAQLTAVMSWYTIMLLHSNTVQVLEVTAVFIMTASLVSAVVYWYAKYDIDKMLYLFVSRPHPWMFVTTAFVWAIPAYVVDPWYSFAALISMYSFFYGSFLLEEKYLSELRKSTRAFLDEEHPFQ